MKDDFYLYSLLNLFHSKLFTKERINEEEARMKENKEKEEKREKKNDKEEKVTEM